MKNFFFASLVIASLTSCKAMNNNESSAKATASDQAVVAGPGAKTRPIYAIAHGVNTVEGVAAALDHGANAIEIDVCPWWKPNEWRAWHDCSTAGNNRYGISLTTMFNKIVDEAKNGRRVTLVWLDIKSANYCSPLTNRTCSVAGLHDLAQKLTANGIQVLYGFYEYHADTTPDVGGRGFLSLKSMLGDLEGMTTSGATSFVIDIFDKYGIPKKKRVVDNGEGRISDGFGNCVEKIGSCWELSQASNRRDVGEIAASLAWTATFNDSAYVDSLLGTARVDGIIAGYAVSTGFKDYDNSQICKNAIQHIRNWVSKHSATHRMANANDRLF